MSPPASTDTGIYCPQHIEFAREVERLKTENLELKRSEETIRRELRDTAQEVSRLKGLCDGSIPRLQQDTTKIFDMLGSRDETLRIYYGQVGELSGTVETLQTDMESCASVAGLEQHAQDISDLKTTLEETCATKESVSNCYMWIRFGFIGIVGIAVLFFLSLLLAKFGVKFP